MKSNRMDAKEINLLPVNSFELDKDLAEIGLSLVAFGKEYDFTEKCFGIKDCDFIQCVLIELIASLKPYAIPFLAVAKSGYEPGEQVTINAQYHTEAFKVETAIHAMQRGLILTEEEFTSSFWLLQNGKEYLKMVKQKLFALKTSLRYAKIDRQIIPQAKPGQFRLLLSTYNPNTVFTLTPVQDKLRLRDDVFQLYIANRLETYYKLKNLGYDNIVNCWALPVSEKVSFNRLVFNDFVDQYFRKAFPFGTPTKRFRSKFKERFLSTLSFVHLLYPSIKKVVSQYEPNALLISSCSTTDAQILIHICSNQGIRVVEMTHGMFQDTPFLKMQNVPVKLVWSQQQKDVMNSHNPNLYCEVVGNPKQDVLLEKYKLVPPDRYSSETYILLISSPGRNTSLSWSTYLTVLEQYIILAKNYPDLKFIFKLHPSENLSLISSTAKELNAPNNLIIEKEYDVYKLLFHAEVVVVITSSIGFEALLWNKKIICFQVPNSERWLPFSNFELAKTAKDHVELKSQIDFFLKNKNMVEGNRFRDYFSFSDGKALDRILDIVLA